MPHVPSPLATGSCHRIPIGPASMWEKPATSNCCSRTSRCVKVTLCLASTIPPGWRQLFLPIDDNYKLGKALIFAYSGADRGRG